MIVVKFQGGLGNKMFQYALFKSFLSSGKQALIDDFSFIPSWDFENNKLQEIFPNATYQLASLELTEQLAGTNNIIHKVRRKIPSLSKKGYIRELSMRYNSTILELRGDFYLVGIWQSEKYFQDYKQIINNSFRFKDFADERNLILSKEMAKVSSVSIHVRKGADYEKKITKGTCDSNYYKRAIDYIQKRIKNSHFFIFTDNKKWVSENISIDNCTIVDWNPVSGIDNYIDMQLMSCCKHNIIANSTYSWWGAWLNDNVEKIVIVPNKWFNSNSPKLDTKDLIPEHWIKL